MWNHHHSILSKITERGKIHLYLLKKIDFSERPNVETQKKWVISEEIQLKISYFFISTIPRSWKTIFSIIGAKIQTISSLAHLVCRLLVQTVGWNGKNQLQFPSLSMLLSIIVFHFIELACIGAYSLLQLEDSCETSSEWNFWIKRWFLTFSHSSLSLIKAHILHRWLFPTPVHIQIVGFKSLGGNVKWSWLFLGWYSTL